MSATRTARAGDFSETAVAELLAREGLRPSHWSNAPGAIYAAHSHAYHKVLYCLRGSIVFRLESTNEDIELRPGDRLDIEPNTAHSAVVGAEGVACIEAARQR